MLNAKNGIFIKRTFKPKKPNENPLRFNGNLNLLTSS